LGASGAGCWVGCLVWLGYTAPPTPARNPPWRGGRCAPPCRRLWRRASPFGLALPRVLFGGSVHLGAGGDVRPVLALTLTLSLSLSLTLTLMST